MIKDEHQKRNSFVMDMDTKRAEDVLHELSSHCGSVTPEGLKAYTMAEIYVRLIEQENL
ncbi:hypothetical protein DsansV1_C08g0081751 [Dioscorea sansibarensis]